MVILLCILVLIGLIEIVWICMCRLCGFGLGSGRVMFISVCGLLIGRLCWV